MINYAASIPYAVQDNIDLFIAEQQIRNEQFPTAWDDDRSLFNFDGTCIDFRHHEELGRLFSLFSTAEYNHQIYYSDYYYVIERRDNKRVECVLYQKQVDHWKSRHFEEWVGRSISANMEYYATRPSLPRHELIPFIPFLDRDNFRHGVCTEYGVYTIYNYRRGGVVARYSLVELQSIWRRDYDSFNYPVRC